MADGDAANVEHLRTVHFGLVAVTLGLLVLVISPGPRDLITARNQIHEILDAVSKKKWAPAFLSAIAEPKVKEAVAANRTFLHHPAIAFEPPLLFCDRIRRMGGGNAERGLRIAKRLILPGLLTLALAGEAALEAPAKANRGSRQAAAQGESQAPGARVTTADQAIDLVIAREFEEVAALRTFSPVIETYTQEVKRDKQKGDAAVKDNYYLGQGDLSKEVVDRSMLSRRKGNTQPLNPLSHFNISSAPEYLPEDFLKLVYVDRENFNRGHYKFEFVRREFLDELRCYVFDVTPVRHGGAGHFRGRV